MASIKSFRACLWLLRKVFIGSIQCSFVPKVERLARVCNDLATNVSVR